MSDSTLARQVFDSMLPEGQIHEVSQDVDSDKLYKGITDFQQSRIDEIFSLACVRDPQVTDMVPDLEVDFGIKPDDRFSEQIRRDTVDSRKSAKTCLGTAEYLQERLNKAGFDVQVHKNDPAVDPNDFLNTNYQMNAGTNTAFAGHEDAFAGQSGGFLVLSGIKGESVSAYLSQAGDMFAGGLHSSSGEFLNSKLIPYVATVPGETAPAIDPIARFRFENNNNDDFSLFTPFFQYSKFSSSIFRFGSFSADTVASTSRYESNEDFPVTGDSSVTISTSLYLNEYPNFSDFYSGLGWGTDPLTIGTDTIGKIFWITPSAVGSAGWAFYAGRDISGGSHQIINSHDSVDLKRWYRISVRYDGSTATMFIDGKRIGSIEIAMDIPLGEKLRMGSGPSGSGTRIVKWYQDDTSVYDVALTDKQILDDYKYNSTSIGDPSWPWVFFVGGDAVRDPITGAITSISPTVIDSARQAQFEDIIIRYKPQGSWGAVVGSYG